MKHNDDPFVDELVDMQVLKQLIQQHPGAVFERLCTVAPLAQYNLSPNLRQEGATREAVEDVDMQPPAEPDVPEAPGLLFTTSGASILDPPSPLLDSATEDALPKTPLVIDVNLTALNDESQD